MRHWIRRALFKNWALKLIAVALALLLFALVHSEKQSLAQGTVAVSFAVPAGKLLVNKPPTALRVGIVGPISRVQRLRIDDLGPLNVDLAGIGEGDFRFHDDLLPLPPGLRVAFIRPESFQLRYEPTLARELPVKPRIEGQVAEGFHVAQRRLRPNKVLVVGPRSVVAPLRFATTEVLTIEGAGATRVERVRVEVPSPIAAAEPAMVEVTVEIVPLARPRPRRPGAVEPDAGL